MEALTDSRDKKVRAIELLCSLLTDDMRVRLKSIDDRMPEYYDDLLCHSSALTDDENDFHGLYEILCAVRFLRLFNTYDFDFKSVHRAIHMREGNWRMDSSGRWVHEGGGLLCPGSSGDAVYRWLPFQVFVLASVFGPVGVFDTHVSPSSKPTLLPSEFVGDDMTIMDRRRLCTDFTLMITRKNDKTGLAAYIQFLFFFFGDINSEIYCCANSKDQAKLLYHRTRDLIRQMDNGEALRMTETVIDWKPSYRGVRKSEIRPLSAGGRTKDGLFAELVVADEFGSSSYVGGKSDMGRLVDVCRSSMGPRRQPLTLTTTTAGVISNGPFIDKLDFLHRLLDRELDYSSGISVPSPDEDRTMCLLYELDDWEKDEEYALTHSRLWRKVSPALGIMVQHSFYDGEMQRAIVERSVRGEVLAKLLNVYTGTKVEEWIRPERVRSLQRPMRIEDCTMDNGWDVYAGTDFSQGNDLHAITYLAVRWSDSGCEFFADMDAWVNEETLFKSSISDLYDLWIRDGWLRVSDGEVFNPNLPVKRIRELDSLGVNFIGIGYDAHLSREPINELKSWLQSMGLKPDDIVVPVSQTLSAFNPAVDRLTFLIKGSDGMLTFSSSPLWPWEFGNSILEVDPRMENRKPVKRNPGASWCKVDNVQCLCMCFLMEEMFCSR